MNRNKVYTLISTAILLLALLLIAGNANAANMDGTIIANGTQEYAIGRTGELFNTSLGGNITQIDVYTSTNQTQNWQGFWGLVDANIFLNGTGGKSMFNWSYDLNGTFVYAKTDSVLPNFATLFPANITNLDRLWFDNETMTDNITNTYKNSTDGMGDRTFVNTAINTSHVNTTAGFLDYVIQDITQIDGSGEKNNTLWAGMIYNPPQTSFNGVSQASYELLVPVNMTKTQAGERYWFFIEIP